MGVSSDTISDTVFQLVLKAVAELPSDVFDALKKAYQNETYEIAKENLRVIIENIQLAKELKRSICQDSGIPVFFVKLGKIQINGDLYRAISQGVIRATAENILRPNVVNVLSRKITNTNVGKDVPLITIEPSNEDFLEITYMPRGGGSENMSALKMLTPGDGLESVKKFVIETVINAGGKPCPPTIIGIGLGGTSDYSLKLAKKSFLRQIGQRNYDKDLAKLEETLLALVNKTGIGPMGLGGNTTALDVFIETADTHVSGLPVAMAFQCWAARKATARIFPNGEINFI